MIVDLLNIQPNIISRDIRSKYILLAGPKKIGKTEFCCQSPNALIMAFEIGTNAQSKAMVQPIDKWSTFKLALRQLEKPEIKERFSTVCIDTVNIAYNACTDFICTQYGVTQIGDIPHGKGYSLVDKEFENALRKITMLKYGLILTSHVKEITDDNGRVIKIKPDLAKRCDPIVNNLVDVIGIITQEWDDKGESRRWIQVKATRDVEAGTRFKYMQTRIPFGYQEFVEELGRAIDEEEKHGAIVADMVERKTTEMLSFKDLMVEAKELWTKLIEKDEANAVTILKKIEIIFGRKLKLSEVTEDQVDLLNLVLIEMREMAQEIK